MLVPSWSPYQVRLSPSTKPRNSTAVPAPPRRGKGPIYFLVIVLMAGASMVFAPTAGEGLEDRWYPHGKGGPGYGRLHTPRRGVHHRQPLRQHRRARSSGPRYRSRIDVDLPGRFRHVVNEGDLIAEIDGQDMKDHLDDVEAQVIQFNWMSKRSSPSRPPRWSLCCSVSVPRAAELLKAKEDLKALAVKKAISQEASSSRWKRPRPHMTRWCRNCL